MHTEVTESDFRSLVKLRKANLISQDELKIITKLRKEKTKAKSKSKAKRGRPKMNPAERVSGPSSKRFLVGVTKTEGLTIVKAARLNGQNPTSFVRQLIRYGFDKSNEGFNLPATKKKTKKV